MESGRGVRVLAGTGVCRIARRATRLGPLLAGGAAACARRRPNGGPRRQSSPGPPSQPVGSPFRIFPGYRGGAGPFRGAWSSRERLNPFFGIAGKNPTAVGLPISFSRRLFGAGPPAGRRAGGAGVSAAARPFPLARVRLCRASGPLAPIRDCDVCRPSSHRPVLKHGPRSLTCARVVGLSPETRRRNECEGPPRGG